MTKNITDRIPTKAECDELMARYSMLPHIVAHSRQVMRVSLALTDHLKDGVTINRDIVIPDKLYIPMLRFPDIFLIHMIRRQRDLRKIIQEVIEQYLAW